MNEDNRPAPLTSTATKGLSAGYRSPRSEGLTGIAHTATRTAEAGWHQAPTYRSGDHAAARRRIDPISVHEADLPGLVLYLMKVLQKAEVVRDNAPAGSYLADMLSRTVEGLSMEIGQLRHLMGLRDLDVLPGEAPAPAPARSPAPPPVQAQRRMRPAI